MREVSSDPPPSAGRLDADGPEGGNLEATRPGAGPGSPAAGALDTSPLAVAALYLVALAVFARLLTLTTDESLRPWYLALESAYLLLYSALWWRRPAPGLVSAVFAVQAVVVFVMLSLAPERDFVSALYVGLAYQAALVLSGRLRLLWAGAFGALIALSLMLELGVLRGLALALAPMAFAVVLPAYAVAREQVEAHRVASERTLAELAAAHRQLEAYAGQIEELARMEERNRLARELHDSVSQTMFSIQLTTRSAQLLLQKDPPAVRPQLEQLQELSQEALRHMRGLIADLDTETGHQ